MKKKKQQDDEIKYENYLDVFIRNYKTVPGFKILVKLGMYFIFILVFVIIASFGSASVNEENKDIKPTETTTTDIVTYKDIINSIYDYKRVELNVDNNISITMNINNDEYEGVIETLDGIKKFKIINDIIYEVKLGVETENDSLFNEINLDYLIPSKIIFILENNKTLKYIENEYINYTYNLENKTINVKTLNDKVYEITINEEGKNYSIKYA